MAIRFHCEACDARVKVPDGSENRKVQCPRCEHLQRVPAHAQELVGAGAGLDHSRFEDRFAGNSQHNGSGDTGSFEASPEALPHQSYGKKPSQSDSLFSPSDPQKGGIEIGDSLADLAKSIVKDVTSSVPSIAPVSTPEPVFVPEKVEVTPPLPKIDPEIAPEIALALEAPVVILKPVVPKPSVPKPIPMMGAPTPKVEAQPQRQSEPAPQPYQASSLTPQASPVSSSALKNLATALRIIPAFLIPVVLWHILSAATLSGMAVTLISGIAIVAMTWTLAEIADTLGRLADRSPG